MATYSKSVLNTQAMGGALFLDGDRLYTSIGFANEKKWSDPEYHEAVLW